MAVGISSWSDTSQLHPTDGHGSSRPVRDANFGKVLIIQQIIDFEIYQETVLPRDNVHSATIPEEKGDAQKQSDVSLWSGRAPKTNDDESQWIETTNLEIVRIESQECLRFQEELIISHLLTLHRDPNKLWLKLEKREVDTGNGNVRILALSGD